MIIVDTNIVFSAILNPNSKVGEIIFNNENKRHLYTSEYLRHEINKHKKKLKALTKKTSDEKLEEVIFQVFNQIEFISDQ